MKSPDAGTFMALGAAVGSVIGVFLDNINMAMGLGAGIGAVVGGILMYTRKARRANTLEE